MFKAGLATVHFAVLRSTTFKPEAVEARTAPKAAKLFHRAMMSVKPVDEKSRRSSHPTYINPAVATT